MAKVEISKVGHAHTESDLTDLGVYPDATGQPATKVAQTDGANGWTFIDTPTGGGGATLGDTVEAETTYGVSSDAGVSTAASRADHTHGTPALPTPGEIGAATIGNAVESETSFGISASVGASTTDAARVDHTHGTPAHGVAQHGHSTLDTRVGLVIVETSTGVWSGDAPSRTNGQYPITFIGATDPADVTNGITTPANINDSDIWVDTSA